MAAVTFRQWKRYRTMAHTTEFTFQNLPHADLRGTGFGFKELLVAILAIKQLSVGFMWKTYAWNTTGLVQ